MACSAAYYISATQKKAILHTDEKVESRGEKATESYKTDAGKGLEQHIAELLLETWEIVFKYFDHNKDKILNEDDVAMEANVYSQLYSLEGSEKDKVNEQLKNVFNCLTFNELEKGISMKNLVVHVVQSYMRDKTQTLQHMHGCAEIMADLLDYDKDGFMSMDELTVFYKDVNMANKNLIQERYRSMCPDTQARCPVENVSEAWTDFLIGDHEERLIALKHVYEENGMPLGELVE